MKRCPSGDKLSTEAFLKKQLNKTSDDSKKWKMAVIGLRGIVGFTVAGFIMFFVRPGLASQTTSLVQIALAAWGGIMVLYLGVQGAVDYKTTSALDHDHDKFMVDRGEDRRE